MSCHYSCSTCSSGYYFDLCLTCPATRTLVASTCPCSSGYYQYQNSQCTGSSSASGIDNSLVGLSTFAFYAAIAIHYLIIILTINRVLSIRLKKIVDTCQVLALIYYYRFLQKEVASKGLKILDAFNFSYLTNLICSQSNPPYHCNSFQNLFGVALSLILFFLLFLVSYFIALCIFNSQVRNKQMTYISNGKQVNGNKQSLGFLTYWYSLSSSIFLLYLDQTVIQTTLSICRIAIVNNYGLLIGIPFLIIIVLIVRSHFTTINDPKQTTLAYRAKHNYFFYYDEQYHLNYIDHLFEQQNLNQNKETLKKPFYPQSNLIIIQILFKILLAASTIVCYQYQPYLLAYCCIFLLVVFSCIMKVFSTYQLFDMWFYYLLIAIHVFALVVFPVSNFFTYFILIVALGMEVMAFMFIIFAIYTWKKEKEGEMFKKTFDLAKELSQKIANLQESDNQLISNKNEDAQISHLDRQNIEASFVESLPGRQASIKNMTHKNSLPEPTLMSQKKQSLSKMNKQSTSNINQSSIKPYRQISRKSFNYDNLSNRLTMRNKNSNPQLLETVHEPSVAEKSQNLNSDARRNTKNIFANQNHDLQ